MKYNIMDLIFTTTTGRKILLEESKTVEYCKAQWHNVYRYLPEYQKHKGKCNLPLNFKRQKKEPEISQYDLFLRNN